MQDLHTAADRFWKLTWERLYHPRTSLFYDFVSSYDPAHRFDHLPTPEEIGQIIPNPNGWSTGMEDSAINGGVMLAAVCDRYDATGEDSLRKAAERIFAGLELCAGLSPRKGFILRSVSPIDGRSYYPESSRDQVTHFVHGLWCYAHSPLCGAAERSRVVAVMADVCADMERAVTPEHDYHYGRENGIPGGVSKMWGEHVQPHEIFRLPMVYAVGWDVTGDPHWRDLALRFARDGMDLAGRLDAAGMNNAYALFQHQVSLEVLSHVDLGDAVLRTRMCDLMQGVAAGMDRFMDAFNTHADVDVATLDLCNWRSGPRWVRTFIDGDYWGAEWSEAFRHAFSPLREAAETLLCILMAGHGALSGKRLDLLTRTLTAPDPRLAFNYAMIYPQAAYWRHARQR
jgi:hypothetical protein